MAKITEKQFEADFELSNGTKFSIVHNVPNIDAAFQNWIVRTNKHTAENFCDYINSKRLKGLTDHYAFTKDQYEQLKNQP